MSILHLPFSMWAFNYITFYW